MFNIPYVEDNTLSPFTRTDTSHLSMVSEMGSRVSEYFRIDDCNAVKASPAKSHL